MNANKMKVLFFLLLACAVPCTASTTLPWRTFSFPNFRFSLDCLYPLENTQSSKDGKSIYLSSPLLEKKHAGFKILIVATPIEKNQEMSALDAAELLKKWNVQDGNMSDIKTQEVAWNCSGLPAVFSVGSCKDKKGLSKRLQMLNVVEPKYWWSVIIQCQNDDPVQEKIADQILASLKVQK